MAKTLNIDRLIVASDFGPKFLNFWPIVAQTWFQVFGITPELALVFTESERQRVDAMRPDLEEYGQVHYLVGAEGYPLGNQAKLARYYLAGQQRELFAMVDDIDTVHVKAGYLVEKFANVSREKLIGLGREVYVGTPHQRNFPAGNFSGPGELFARLFNPENLSFIDYIQSFNKPPIYSSRENPVNTPGKFSDEYLISALLDKTGLRSELVLLDRDQDIKREWLDRSWWASKTDIEVNKENFEVINFLRPLLENKNSIQEALDILVPGVKIDIVMDERLKVGILRRLRSHWVAI